MRRFGFLCHDRTSSSFCLRNDEGVCDPFSRPTFLALEVLLKMLYRKYSGNEFDLFCARVREQVLVIICPHVCKFGFPTVSQLSQNFSCRHYSTVIDQLIEL